MKTIIAEEAAKQFSNLEKYDPVNKEADFSLALASYRGFLAGYKFAEQLLDSNVISVLEVKNAILEKKLKELQNEDA